jgi:hypothetical protein
VASFFWLQSMVRDDGARRILFDLDQSVQRLSGELGGTDRSVIELTGCLSQSATALGRRLSRKVTKVTTARGFWREGFVARCLARAQHDCARFSYRLTGSKSGRSASPAG